MSPQTTKRAQRHRGLRSAYVWHRWLGVASAIIVLMLAVTGILLNHGHDLNLDRSYINSGWILDWYGIRGTSPANGYSAGGHWISSDESEIFFDQAPVANADGPLVAATECCGVLIAATAGNLMLISDKGELVERMATDALPGKIKSATGAGNSLIIETDHGRFESSADLLQWKPVAAGTPLKPAEAQALPAEIREAVSGFQRKHALTRERVLADIHSGRILGRSGTLAMDAAALGFMALALSGLWLWTRHLRAQKQRRHRVR